MEKKNKNKLSLSGENKCIKYMKYMRAINIELLYEHMNYIVLI